MSALDVLEEEDTIAGVNVDTVGGNAPPISTTTIAYEAFLQNALDHLCICAAKREGPIAIGFSGGEDSLFLLMLAKQVLQKRCIALHIHHGLRANASIEAEQCRSFCKEQGIAFDMRVLSWEKGIPRSNVQEKARKERLLALEDLCLQHGALMLLLAHHDDDRIETFFLHLQRGSGVDGLSGIPMWRTLPSGILLGRPLLTDASFDWPAWQGKPPTLGACKQHIRMFLKTHGLFQHAIQDPSNHNPVFARSAIRHQLLPALKDRLAPWAVLRCVENAQRASTALQFWTCNFIQEHIQRTKDTLILPLKPWKSLPEEIQFRVLAELLQETQKTREKPRLRKLMQVAANLKNNVKCTLMHCILHPKKNHIHIYKEPGKG